MMQREEERLKNKEKWKSSKDLSNWTRKSNSRIIGIAKEEEREQEMEILLKQTVDENFPYL